MVREELVHAPFQVVEERTVPREEEVHVQTPQACNGVEVTPERPRGRVCPQSDVRSDLEQQVVSGEQEPPSLVVQDEVKIRVARRVHDPGLAASELERVSLLQRQQALRQADAEPRGSCRRFSRLRVHAVADQVPYKVFCSPVRVPDATGVLDLPFEHPDRRPATLFQPTGEPYVIRVQMCHDDPCQVTLQVQANLSCASLPRLTGRRIVEAGVYDRPPVAVLDEVRRDELQGERHRQLDLKDAVRDARRLADGLCAKRRRSDAHEITDTPLSTGGQISEHRALAYLTVLRVGLLPVLLLDPLREQPVHEGPHHRGAFSRVASEEDTLLLPEVDDLGVETVADLVKRGAHVSEAVVAGRVAQEVEEDEVEPAV